MSFGIVRLSVTCTSRQMRYKLQRKYLRVNTLWQEEEITRLLKRWGKIQPWSNQWISCKDRECVLTCLAQNHGEGPQRNWYGHETTVKMKLIWTELEFKYSYGWASYFTNSFKQICTTSSSFFQRVRAEYEQFYQLRWLPRAAVTPEYLWRTRLQFLRTLPIYLRFYGV